MIAMLTFGIGYKLNLFESGALKNTGLISNGTTRPR